MFVFSLAAFCSIVGTAVTMGVCAGASDRNDIRAHLTLTAIFGLFSAIACGFVSASAPVSIESAMPGFIIGPFIAGICVAIGAWGLGTKNRL